MHIYKYIYIAELIRHINLTSDNLQQQKGPELVITVVRY